MIGSNRDRGFRLRLLPARRLLALVLASGSIGCSALPPTDTPPTFLLSWLDANAPTVVQEFERKQCRVRIESPQLSGTFTAALIRRNGATPAVRLQLYPELGGRVLDLAATPTSFEGIIPQAEIDLSWSAEDGKPPRHLFTFLAASLITEGAPLGAERAVGAAPGPDQTWRVLLTTPFEGLVLVAYLDAYGVVDRMDYSLRNISWYELSRRPKRKRVIAGQDFHMEFLEEVATPTGSLPDSLFRLERDASAETP